MSHSKTHRHFKLYKPHGYLSQLVNNQYKRHKKKFIGSLYPFPEHLLPIGRQDEQSEGMQLHTTHGQASEYIRSSQIEKEYYALVDGILTAEAVSSLTHGVNISVDGQPYLAKAKDAYLFFERPNVPDRFVRDEKH